MVCFLIAFITVQQVCALAALTVIKHRLEGKNPIGEDDLERLFPCGSRMSAFRQCRYIITRICTDRYKIPFPDPE